MKIMDKPILFWGFELCGTLLSVELKKLNRIESNKRVYKVLDQELKENIHSLQILIS